MSVSQYFVRVATKAKAIKSALEDYEFLAAILSGFSQEKHKSSNSYKDDIFSYKEDGPSDLRTLCTVSERCGGVWTAREGVDWLLFYIFYRRYGWDEASNQQLTFQVYMPSVAHRLRSASKDDEMRFKERIVAVSADLISWLDQHPLYLSVIKMYNSAIRISRSSNVTRHQMIHHTLRWISRSLEAASGALAVSSPGGRRRSFYAQQRSISVVQGTTPHSPFLPDDATPETMYMAVKELIILCATDSQPKIRYSVIHLIGRLLHQLSLNTCLRLLDSIIEIFNRQEVTSWDAAEGYLNVMGLLVKRVVACNSDDDVPSQGNHQCLLPNMTPLGPTTMSFESFQKDLLPRIKMLVFNLFDHTHPYVRIGAVHLYITCLKRCPHAVIQTALDEIMNEVCVIPAVNGLGGDDTMSPSLGANATESLLSLCKILLRRSGGISLPPSTGELQNSLIQTYLGHANTNVRIAACQVYETLIYSALHNQHRVRYLLNKVMENWTIRQDVLLAPLRKVPIVVNGPPEAMIINPGNMTNWHEGRLRIYQAVCRMFMQKHLTALCDTLIRISDYDSGVASQDDVFTDTTRNIYRNTLSTASRKTMATSRRSLLYEAGPAAELRAVLTQMDDSPNSRRSSVTQSPTELSYSQQSSKGLIGSRILLPNLMSKKNSTAVTSILDQFRAMDENEKIKITDPSRTSTWRTEIAKRLSMATGKIISKTSAANQQEGEPTRMRVLFANLLHASIECLVAEPRELRQCARQAFPEISRLFRWFDANLTMEFFTMHLVEPPTLMSYACLKMLRASLLEFKQYEKRYFSNVENPIHESSSHSSLLELRGKPRHSSDCIPDAYFLNCPLIRCLFNAERSTIWLGSCQQYLFEDNVPTFISLPAVDCVMLTLSLAHLMPQFTQAVQWTESNQQQTVNSTMSSTTILSGEKASNSLAIDPAALVDAVQALVGYVCGFEVILDDRFQPSTTTGEHLRLGALRPYCQRRPREPRGQVQRHPPLATFLIHLVSSMEDILFYYLPPSLNPPRPSTATRFTAGRLLLPILLPVSTWPLALLPPTPKEASSPYSEKDELRVLAVRRLLRLIAAIVHALPLASNQTSMNMNASAVDPNSLAAHAELLTRGRVDLTGTVNSYFAQLEKILTQLREACNPVPLCLSSSWWWLRALCEHMPRLMQIAPHANPVSLIRLLLDEVGKSGTRGMARLGNPTRPRTNISPRAQLRWAKAIEYARRIAAAKISAKQPKAMFAYRWPTVSVLLRTKSQGEATSEQVPRERSSLDTVLRGRVSSQSLGLDGEDDLVFDALLDSAHLDRRNSAFDSMVDDEPDLVIEPAECDTSSGEETSIEFDAEGRKRVSTLTSRRKRTTSSTAIKAQAIETPPPFTDVVGLVKRIWPLCQPVTIGTLKTLLSPNELTFITGENDPGYRAHRSTIYR